MTPSVESKPWVIMKRGDCGSYDAVEYTSEYRDAVKLCRALSTSEPKAVFRILNREEHRAACWFKKGEMRFREPAQRKHRVDRRG